MTGQEFVNQSKWHSRAGWAAGTLPSIGLMFSAAMKLAAPPEAVEGFAHLGWSPSSAVTLAVIEIVCVLVYLWPQTAILGAILTSAYMGGAIATHLRLGEPVCSQVLIGMLFWFGIFLRDARLRDLLPLRRAEPARARL